ncbi:ligase-associated DNA damage response DEXH box helicase [Pelagicoccus sp. SDUM812002]|uniref:ligase-associated DNA damage response DEXH box helicase n=1 Tax=Pelagicoccus sp. SDUM812002 TaxID=3041266 RepID=UPI00280CA005|nr:ligase-associated DNA damage response DEXH box helicase [Pelagicoccus sp. SDUM812002]MDQ8187964.1 ligase-associated DNA damage response DEXH box helicase [Pelagicoccus sp. SDUM812002]
MRIPAEVKSYFARRSWKVAAFQREAWRAYLSGESVLINAPTGTGKTLAAWMGPVIEALEYREESAQQKPDPITVLWVTPLRALAADTVQSLRQVVGELGLNWSVELRTGDTAASVKARQKKRLPTCLVTTPESLSLALSYREMQDQLGQLKCIFVDEWHELLASKRGVQLELCMARLRRLNPDLRTWALTATIGNLDEALSCLVGSGHGRVIRSNAVKRYRIHSILPKTMERFPWSGHIGLTLLPQVVQQIEKAETTLVFTNTRSQAELWFEKLKERPTKWTDKIALHHSSLSRETRDEVEEGLKNGAFKCVVCTSSLDLGVDFQPVEQVMQIGSPKGVARLLQRAGRSGHRPGQPSAIYCVPTHALELAEIAAARIASEEGQLEKRIPLKLSLDVLAQHCVTLSLADGFVAGEVLEEVRSTSAFSEMTDQQWQWTLDFMTRGGTALKAYPQFNKVKESDGKYRAVSRQVAQRHRMTIGTISNDGSMRLQWLKGGYIGSVEESFIGKLKKGDSFLFGGRILELVSTRDMTASVRVSKNRKRIVPRWAGGRIPLSTRLAETLRHLLSAGADETVSPEMLALKPLLEIQQSWSKMPLAKGLLVERIVTREGHHSFFYPFAGRFAHEGLGNLVALRLSRLYETTFHVSANDYGFELLSRQEVELTADGIRELLSPTNWREDLLSGINEAELSKRRFRGIARVSGLVFAGYPGKGKSVKQLQVSSSLLFEVLRKYDPENLLVEQSLREVLLEQIDQARIEVALSDVESGEIEIVTPERLTPLAFPLWAERIRSQTVSSETWETRVRGMAERLSKIAEAKAQRV